MKITKALFLVLFVIMLVTLLASCASIKCMDPFNDHTIVIDEAVEPTCSSTGLTQGEHCKDCGKIFVAQSIIPETSHTEVIDAAVNPSCTKEGRTEGSHCADCGKIFVEQKKIPMEKHNIVVIPEIAPTCTTDGYTEGSQCKDCKEKFIEPTVIPYGHYNTADIPSYDSTCSSVGATKGEFCVDCKEILIQSVVIPMKPHTESDWIIDKEASEFEAGKKHTVCTVCDSIVKEEIIPQIAYFSYSVNPDGVTCTIVGVQVLANIELYIPEYLDGYKVIAIGDEAFINNKQIIAAYIPATVTNIGVRAFSGCSALAVVDIPNGVTSIGFAAFAACTNLTTIVIPNTITYVGTAAFELCSNLNIVYYCGTLDMWRNIEIGTNNDVLADEYKIRYYSDVDPDTFGPRNGIVEEDGKLWWYVDDIRTYGGLMLIDGYYYYARTSGEIVANTQYKITKTNKLLPESTYTFGIDGKILNAPNVKNGIYEEGGKLWWYVCDVKSHGGLMLIDGAYYYARTSGEIVINASYYTTLTNDLLPAGTYKFGADGKMINPPVDDTEDPTPSYIYWHYVNGVVTLW